MSLDIQKEMQQAYSEGGYRERFAIDNGTVRIALICGHKCFKFTYKEDLPYQDANGAIYDTVTKTWIN